MPAPEPPVEYRFKPGQSGNPGGRPKGTSLTARLRKVVEAEEGKVADALIKAAAKAALKGDFRFWNAIFERLDGKVPDSLNVGGNLTVIFEEMAARAERESKQSEDADSGDE